VHGSDTEPGAAFVYRELGGTWMQEAELAPEVQDPYARFGRSLALQGPYLLVGALGDDDAAPGAGCAYLYEETGGAWDLRKKLYGHNSVGNDQLGWAVAWRGGPAFVANRPSPGGGPIPWSTVYAYELDPACPDAEFSAHPLAGILPLTVDFTDLSTGAVDEWSWSFGDGGTSTVQHPTHTYATQPGSQTVSLVVEGPDGVDREIQIGYVSVEPPAASWTYRNGSGLNRDDYIAFNLPVLGTVWMPAMTAPDVSGALFGHVAASRTPHPGVLLGPGELLILPPLVGRWSEPILAGSSASFSIPIPNELSLLGVEVSTQGVFTRFDQGQFGLELMNALDLVLGL